MDREDILRQAHRLQADLLYQGRDAPAVREAIAGMLQVMGNNLSQPIIDAAYSDLNRVFDEGDPPFGNDLVWEFLHPGEDLPPFEWTDSDNWPAPRQALLDAGMSFPGVNCVRSPQSDFLQTLATGHAGFMAQTRRQGHQNFNDRFKKVIVQYGVNTRCSEICAESWHWETAIQDAARSMFKAWKYSRGHWSVASKLHQFIGLDMARSRTGIWYAVIIAINNVTS